MSDYTPTAADYTFLLENHPDVFADRGAARTVLNQLQTSTDGHNALRMQALGENYRRGGNPPMTASPVPVTPGDPAATAFDPAFAAACVDCQPSQPCCLTAGTIKDFEDPSRKIEWPATGTPPATRLYIIAKEVRGQSLSGKVRVEGTGRDCQAGHPQRSRFTARNLASREQSLPRSASDVEVGYPQNINTLMALQNYVPAQALLFLGVCDLLTSAAAFAQGAGGATITPAQCVSDGPMRQGFNVVAFPQAKAEGDATVAVGVHFLTTGIGGTASIEGNLTGKYGALDISAAARSAATPTTGRSLPTAQTDSNRLPGMVATLSSIIGNFSETLSQSSPSPNRVVDRTDFGSGVRFNMALKLAATGIELKAKRSTPDLEAKIGKLETSLTMTARGTVDFIDVAAQVMLSPAGARLVQEARATMANSANAVRADLRAEVEVSAEGELKHVIDSGVTIPIPANGPAPEEPSDMTTEFGGKLMVRGQATIRIHVEGEVWIASAEAGAAGTAHTGWVWELKVDAQKKRKKRYYFEGLMARATGYARIGTRSRARRGPSARETVDMTTSRGVSASQSGPGYSVGDPNWNNPNASRSELADRGAVYVLIPPTVERVTSSAPPWQDY